MRINTTPEIFTECKLQFAAAKKVSGEADMYISTSPLMDEYEFTLKVSGGVATVSGGSKLSAMWGFYEYLARFYGYLWQTPDKTIKSDAPVKPITNMNYSWKQPFDICWFHWQIPNKWRDFLSKFHRYVSRRPHDTFKSQCHQKGKNGDPNTDWAIIYKDLPEIFAKNADGKIIHGQYEKFDYANNTFIGMVAAQAIYLNEDYFNLFPPDGTNFNATAVKGKKPLYTWRGWTNMTEYMLEYYAEIAWRVPRIKFDIYAYLNYRLYPEGSSKFFTPEVAKRFNCFFADTDIANYINWQEAGFNMIYRPNVGYASDLSTKEVAIEAARQFMRFKSIGMNGFMFDINKINLEKLTLFVYLISRQIYSNAPVDSLVEEFYK